MQQGLEFPSTLPWPKTSPAYDDAKANAYPFDLDKAASLLQGRGRERPFTGDVIMQNSNAELTSFAQILQSDFAKLGITLNLKPQDTAAYLDVVNNWKYNGFWLGGGSFAQLDPATAFHQEPRAERDRQQLGVHRAGQRGGRRAGRPRDDRSRIPPSASRSTPI